MATQTHELTATRVKWAFFALIGLCALAIIPVDAHPFAQAAARLARIRPRVRD
jgi:hypothetical protein